ncbi:PTS sugar transporter subunit IIB [Leuconostoc lactis]|uniref:PTS sugar transporter subunit IIB n=1 Tax=Leuconostoc lactis TaxID=1246 RepID=UPI0021A3B77E|nr:PTS sugar transporter subunit IIB [Leuconostoc lactis]MCT3114846.1 PTS sugar transporter subunit IIB [Leuconostoc lactis]
MAMDNKKMMLVCDQTPTITRLVSAIKKAATAQEKSYTIIVTSQSHVDEQLRAVQPDIVLLTPELVYLKTEMQRQTDEFGVLLAVINLSDYTQMAGANILLTAEQLLVT